MAGGGSNRISRLFEMADETRERLTRVEASARLEQEQISELRNDVKELTAKMNQLVGKNAVMAAIYGVIGTVVAAVVAFFITSSRGA